MEKQNYYFCIIDCSVIFRLSGARSGGRGVEPIILTKEQSGERKFKKKSHSSNDRAEN